MAAVMLMSMLTACGNKDNAGNKDNNDVNTEETDKAAADKVAALIDAIYVQERTEETDAQCEAAKAAWDALTDAQKELVYNYATLLAALEKAGHNPELKNAKPATCTEDGYTGDEVCKTCGETVTKGEVVKATGHHYKDGKCTVCGAADPNYKPAVKTGDESNTALWVLVMASAAMLAAAVVVLPRKKHSR